MTPINEDTIQESDHDLLIQLNINMLTLQTSMIELKKDIGEMKTMCGQRLPHCLGMFATEKRLDALSVFITVALATAKLEMEKAFESRDTWSRWSLGLSITSLLAILGMIVTLVVKLH